MPTAESVKAKLQGLIDQANETTGSGDADLTTAVGSLIAGFGQGGGKSIEKGELFLPSAKFEFNITVSDKYSNILVVPKILSEPTNNITYPKAVFAFYAAEGYGIIEAGLTTTNSETFANGASYWYNETQTDYGAVFTEARIDIKLGYTPMGPLVNYCWYAW